MTQESSTPATPEKISRYKLGALIGRGGQGKTYRAIDTHTNQPVAIKVIELKADEGWKPFDLFERECRVLRSLRHPGIPKYLDTFAAEEQGSFSLVMELVDGQPLNSLLDGKPLPDAQLWNILHQALEILDYLHGLKPPVIHRDIKPDNLILRPNNSLALVDFGGVRLALRPEGGSTVIGTFGYMAPEQLHGAATPATDIFGLGATICALATGRDADRLPRQGLKVDLKQLMQASPLRALLQQMIEPEPGQRPQSVSAVRLAADQPKADRPANTSHTPPDQSVGNKGGPAKADDVGVPDRDDLDSLAPFFMRLVGTLGYLGLALVEAFLLPLAFFIARRLTSGAKKRDKLKTQRREFREALRQGRKSMRKLSETRYAAGHRLPRGRRPPRRGRRGRHRH